MSSQFQSLFCFLFNKNGFPSFKGNLRTDKASSSMNKFIVLICFHLCSSFFCVEAQFAPANETPRFQPSLGLVIGILSAMFFLTFALLVYAKFCHSRASNLNGLPVHHGFPRSSSRFSGLDKTIIESLPFFRFSALKGSKQGLECAVCLSKFEDIEILRLLPKCKHAFHIDCIDHWLEKQANCPLCRQRVSSEDVKSSNYSNSMRFLLTGQSELRQDSNIEFFVEREGDDPDRKSCSSRFSVGNSFRKSVKTGNEKEMLIEKVDDENDGEQQVLHKHNHKIIVSDFVFQNRWSNVSSSDLMFLNTEMLSSISGNRFSSMAADQTKVQIVVENELVLKIKEEMEMKRTFESKISNINANLSSSIENRPSSSSSNENSRITNPKERRSVSEITGLSRFSDLQTIKNRVGNSWAGESGLKEEKTRQIWYPIARRTVQWFADRESRSRQSENTENPETLI